MSEELKKGVVYRIRSRNLSCGVYDGRGGFIGIRKKFGSRYLDCEYWDGRTDLAGVAEYLGTAYPQEQIAVVPEGIPLKIHLGTEDEVTGREVAFDLPVADGGKGWYFKDTGEASDKIRPMSVTNKQLFEFLDKLS
jgi:hypothetical protein